MPTGTCPGRSDDDKPCGLGVGHLDECEGKRPQPSAKAARFPTGGVPASNGNQRTKKWRSRHVRHKKNGAKR